MYWVAQIDLTQTTPHSVTQVTQFAMKYYLTTATGPSLVDFPILLF